MSGPLLQDVAGFASDVRVPMVFGTITEQSEDFYQLSVVDGIVGMSKPGSSSFGYHSLFEAEVRAGVYARNVFGMCLDFFNGGVLNLGFYDDALFEGSVAWTPQKSERAYEVNVESISLGGQSIGVPPKGYIVDMGTATLLLQARSFKALQSAIMQAMCAGGLEGTAGRVRRHLL
jgi:Eukaryotic aspartyl protease